MECDFTLYDMIARNALLFPEDFALVDGGCRTTYEDFKRRCDLCASGLVAEGITEGDRIAVFSGSSNDFMILLGAAAKIGAVLVPVNMRLGEDEIAYILQDTAPACLFSASEFRDLALKLGAKTAGIKRSYVFGNEDSGDGTAIPGLRPSTVGEVPGIVNGDKPCLIIHTAAVGSRPRGAILSHANLLACGLQIVHLLQLGSRDCYLGLLPLFHIGGLSMTVATMLAGGKTVLMNRFDPQTVPGLIADEKGTFFVTFPPMLAAILDAEKGSTLDLKSLRAACGVDAPETIERFLSTHPQAVFYSLYGQTETMPVSGGDYRLRPGSIGKPALLTHVALFDDADCPVPAETPGEICVRSPAVFQGYWNLPQDSAWTSRSGWHHTGDLGRLDADGFLWYAGRKPEKELIKTGGENVYPAEVEKALLAHDAVAEACVIGVPDAQWGEAVKAVCVLKKGCQVGEADLIDFVAARIARYKKPKHVAFVDELPKTAQGAVDRVQVKKTFAV